MNELSKKKMMTIKEVDYIINEKIIWETRTQNAFWQLKKEEIITKNQGELIENQNELIENQDKLIEAQEIQIKLLKNLFTSKTQNESYQPTTDNQKTEDGFVYIIKDTKSNYCKIGMTVNLAVRLKDLEVGNPNMIMIASTKSYSYRKLEKRLHKVFEPKRIKGEWFDLNHKDISKLVNDYLFNLHIN